MVFSCIFMLLLLTLVCISVFYFLVIGYLTMFESKVMGVLQSSKGVSKVSFINLYHFYLDFLKIIFKGILESKLFVSNFMYITILVFILFIMILAFFMFPFNCFGILIHYNMFLYLILDGVLLILKVLFLMNFSNQVIYHLVSRVKKLYLFLEVMFFCSCYPFIFLLMTFKNQEVPSHICFYLFYLILFLILFIKLFSTPFDYFEMESEFVGGLSLEISGIGYAIWSLVEYGFMLNNMLFFMGVIKIINPIFLLISKGSSAICIMLFILMIFMFSGLLLSVSVSSIFVILLFLSLMLFIISFYLITIFFMINLILI